MNYKMLKSKSGFTLIEVMVALIVFVIGVVSIYPLFSQGLRMLSNNDSKIIASTLAQSKIAELESIGFDSTPTAISRTDFPAPYAAYEYEVSWSTAATDIVSSASSLIEGDLTIYWMEGAKERDENFKFYLARIDTIN